MKTVSIIHGVSRLIAAIFGAIFWVMSVASQAMAGTGTSGDPFTSLSEAYSVTSGRYYFDLGSGIFQADVDNSEGGGWVLVLQYVHQGGTNPALSVLGAGADLPELSAAALGTDESANSARWGHAGNAAAAQFTGDIELRWYGETSGHGRIIHFRSSVGDDYFRTGAGNFDGIQSSFTALAGHTANLPASATSYSSLNLDQGDAALTKIPLYMQGTYHWAIHADFGSGNEDRWEVDDTPGNYPSTQNFDRDTIHRVWVRAITTTTVTNTNNSGAGSLREAIATANSSAGPDVINFAIPGAGPHTIPVSGQLALTDENITIDGTTQSGASCGTLTGGTQHDIRIVLDGAGANDFTFNIQNDNTTIRGLSLIRSRKNHITAFGGDNGTTLECNYFGVEPNGTTGHNSSTATDRQMLDFNGGTNLTVRNNLISANADDPDDIGLYIRNWSGAVVTGNIIGLTADGASALGNADMGILIEGTSSGITVGGLGANDGNIISGNGTQGIEIADTSSGIAILGNTIGLARNGTTELGNGAEGVLITGNNTTTTIGGTAAAAGNIISGNGGDGIYLSATSTGFVVEGNTIGFDASGTLDRGNGGNGIRLNGSGAAEMIIGGETSASANQIGFNANDGVAVTNNANAAIFGNRIVSNTGLGIDLVGGTEDGNGVTANDENDGDGGSNSLLNFPVINSVSTNGGTSVDYDITLDTTSHNPGYRVDFYKDNTSGDTHGEGDIHLGHVDIAYDGTTETFSGTLTALATVSSGDSISAVTTRKTSGSSFDQSSEFGPSQSATSSASPLVVTNTNDSGAGSLRSAIDYANANPAEDAITFDIPGTGVKTITLISPLPDITDDEILIDGTTQGDASCGDLWNGMPHTIRIQVDGAGSAVEAFVVRSSSDVSLRGMSVTNFANRGVRFSSTSIRPTLTCSYVGLNPDGTGSGSPEGIYDRGNSSAVGGPNVGDGNVISANSYGIETQTDATNSTYQGNFIGTDPLGMAARPNSQHGIAATNLGAATWSSIRRNLISGNTADGINLPTGFAITGASGDVIIAGNYIGVDRTGNAQLPNGGEGISFEDNTISGVTIGGIDPTDRNIISGNLGDGVNATKISNLTFLNNYVGLAQDGLSDLGNGGEGLNLQDITGLTIGNGGSTGRNVIAGNEARIMTIHGTNQDILITGNYFGVDQTGNTALVNGATPALSDGIWFGNITNLDLIDNVFGGIRNEAIEFWGNSTGSDIVVQGNHVGVGADGVTPLASGRAGLGLLIFGAGYTASGVLIGGETTAHANIFANSLGDGIAVLTNSGVVSADITGNKIFDNAQSGIDVGALSAISITQNLIYENGSLGLDIGTAGLTPNDANDEDVGPNDLLNFPVINSVSADGTTTVGFDFDLDTQTNTNGYRIEFFRNSAGDASGHGEGEVYLGHFDTGTYTAGSSLNFTGSFTASEAVPVGAIISATATRKTDASSYDATSEFAQNRTAASPLVVTNTNDSGAGSLRAAIDYANANAAEDAITFDIPGAGPHTISPLTALPTITDDNVSIDGSSQTGASCGDLWAGNPHTLSVRIDANTSSYYGLTIDADDVMVKGLSITGFARGASMTGNADRTIIQCNFLGLDPNGVLDGFKGSNGSAVWVGGEATQVGGPAVGDGNVIASGPETIRVGVMTDAGSTNTVIQGNFIGTDPTGMSARSTFMAITHLNGAGSWAEISDNLISGVTNSMGAVAVGPDDTLVPPNSGRTYIRGNIIGLNRTGTAALANNGSGIWIDEGLGTLTIGGTNDSQRNVISGNLKSGLEIYNTSDINIRRNYVGLDQAGTAAIGNGIHAIRLQDTSSVNIGNGLATGRNVLAGNASRTLTAVGTYSDLVIADNFFGTDATGNATLVNGTSGNAVTDDAIAIFSGTNVDIVGNVFGGYSGGVIELLGPATSSGVTIQGNSIGIGADGTTQFATVSNGLGAILKNANHTTSALVIGGMNPGDGNVISGAGNAGIRLIGGSGVIEGNIVKNTSGNGTTGSGVVIEDGDYAITQNFLSDNAAIGIDLGGDGITSNDAGDADTGANTLLNYPVINSVSADGTTLTYDIDLDTQTNTQGYRIEFFRNDAGDASGHGEGQTYLGSFDTGAYTAGTHLNFTGSFTASEAVSVGAIISATTTRKTGASSYDATSEFAQNETVASPLVVTNTNDSGAGSLRAAIEYANANAAEDAITFNIPGTGVKTITLASSLPLLLDNGLTIDGTTQSGASCGQLTTGTPHTIMIEIDGNAGTAYHGLRPRGDGIVLKGLSVGGFGHVGVESTSTNAVFECNYFGLAADGSTARPSALDDTFTSTVYIAASGTTFRNNVVSGNTDDANDRGLAFHDSASPVITGNIIGLNAAGTAERGANGAGLSLTGTTSGAVVGGDTAVLRNVISGNGTDGISVTGTATNVTLLGNYIGLSRDGASALGNGGVGVRMDTGGTITIGGVSSGQGNVISGNGSTGVVLNSVSAATVLGNYIGVGADGTTARSNAGQGISIGTASNIDIGNGTAAGLNVISANRAGGVQVSAASDVVIALNHIGVALDGTTKLPLPAENSVGVSFQGDSTGEISDNIISYGSQNDGVEIGGALTRVALLRNSIYDNGGEGIEIDTTGPDEGPNANDPSDTDSGANDELNFPVLNAVTTDGSTAVSFDLTLDTQTNANGYRIEFFRNATADPSGHGEGEVYLGFYETGAYTAGTHLNYVDSFTASETVPVGSIISATTTRKTGASSYDATSEFAQTQTASAPFTAGTGFTMRVDTRLAGTSNSDQFLLELRSGQTASIAWGDGTMDLDLVGPQTITHTYPSGGIYDVEVQDIGHIFHEDSLSHDVTKIIDILQWGDNVWGSMDSMFEGAINLTSYSATDTPDLSGAASLEEMFKGSVFNGDIGNWDTSSITRIDDIFRGNTVFNQDIGSWDVSSATLMNNMFNGATAFNQDLTNWDTREVTDMDFMFTNASSFNGDISGWETGKVTRMSSMFQGASSFNRNINTVVAGGNRGGTAWDVSNVTLMNNMFRDATVFNGNISAWDTSSVVNMGHMFREADAFNQNIGSWTTSAVQDFSGTFYGADLFNQDIGGWNTGAATNMTLMFTLAPVFDQDIGGWNVAGVTNMGFMFSDAISFNQNLNGWTTSSLENMRGTFQNATAYNSPIDNWDVADVTDFRNTFAGASLFNQDISGWTTSSAIDMTATFLNASAFDQDLGGWDVADVTDMTSMLNGSGLSVTNYDSALNGWAAQTLQPNVPLGAVGMIWCTAGPARTTLTSAPNNWTIMGDSQCGDGPLVVTRTDDLDELGTLRYAINWANANAADDAITFNIPNAGPHRITIGSALPFISDNDVSIDGTTQAGASCGNLWAGEGHTLQIELDGVNKSFYGLYATGDRVTFRGLSAVRFSGGLVSGETTEDTQISCNYVGLYADGTAAGNTTGIIGHGLRPVIGGPLSTDGNVASGNSSPGISAGQDVDGLIVQNNFLGTTPDGMTIQGNGSHGIQQHGGASTPVWDRVERNLISGNGNTGIIISADLNVTGPPSQDVRIIGNYIGTNRLGTAAIPNTQNGITLWENGVDGITIGGTGPTDGNIISGNTGSGIDARGISNLTVLGNHIGVAENGTSPLGNALRGIFSLDLTNVTIGDGTTSGRNVVGDNAFQGVVVGTANVATISGNHIGVGADGTTPLGNGGVGLTLVSFSAGTGHSNTNVTDNVISDNGGHGIDITSNVVNDEGATANITIARNKIGVAANGTTPIGNTESGIKNSHVPGTIVVGGDTSGDANIIAYNGESGIRMAGLYGQVAALSNRIFGNAVLGIDLGDDGVPTLNDPGDPDGSHNDGLNFPVLNSVSGVGTSVSYDLSLDVPAHGPGYRIDFFKNGAADPSGYGQGEIPLGFVNVAGPGTHTGSFTATEAVAQGDVITATTTRRTASGSWDITSEFSLSYGSASPTELSASKSVDVFDPTNAGLYALPGNDIISTLTVSNPGNAPADTDSIVLIDAVPPEMIFYNGDMDDAGPATAAVHFVQSGGAGLTFNPATDARYSNSPTRPSDMSACTYTPTSGYDDNVTFVCMNPKGAMAAGDPDPSFTLQFRARIR